jgi:type II secretory pathway pseudopilin PulG
MVALLVAMSVMAILMGAALPAYHTMARREKETELIFRGEQYARAIGMWQQKFANQPAPSVDVLVEQRFLRKKYKDPITNDDFQPLGAGSGLPGQTQQGSASQTPTGARGAASGSAAQGTRVTSVTAIAGSGASAVVGGIVGVTSKSTDKSLRLYNGRDTYNQWVFMPVARGNVGDAGAGGGGGGGRGADGRGGRGADGRGGRGATDGRGTFDLNRGFDGFNRGQGDGGRGGRGGQGGQGDTGRGGRGGTPPTR